MIVYYKHKVNEKCTAKYCLSNNKIDISSKRIFCQQNQASKKSNGTSSYRNILRRLHQDNLMYLKDDIDCERDKSKKCSII
jgi:hypothetical protein